MASPTTNGVKNIVLVHGAWADGSSWFKVVPLLQAKGFHVVCTQNALSGLADDVAIVRRILDAQDGPVILAESTRRRHRRPPKQALIPRWRVWFT